MVTGSWYTVDGKNIEGLSELKFSDMANALTEVEAAYECIVLEESERLGWCRWTTKIETQTIKFATLTLKIETFRGKHYSC
ncbi:hypothetical protein AB4518_22100 [Vibrio sp. 10N.222.54.E8]|uniref:hypothetical protein n=1 Tax=Vibrio sp. 10N.222.54.E8 TaxID=3229643 RepID=UPI00354E6355